MKDSERYAREGDQPNAAAAQKREAEEEAKGPVKKAAAKKSTPGTRRREANANREADKQAEEMDEPVEDKVLPEEREEWFQSPGFARMRTSWEGEDGKHLQRVQGLIERKVFETFQDALAVINDLYELVREQDEAPNPLTGEMGPAFDAFGWPVWKRDPRTGAYFEDWTRLTHAERENFLFRITTSLFDWEQRAVSLWTEAMFAKAMFTEHFAIEYDAPMSGTIDDRNARGNVEAAEDRYFALMNTAVSRRADAVVRTMTNLMLRLKDTIQQ